LRKKILNIEEIHNASKIILPQYNEKEKSSQLIFISVEINDREDSLSIISSFAD
jgi:hypothetical protein